MKSERQDALHSDPHNFLQRAGVSSFLEVPDAVQNGPLQPLGLLVYKVKHVQKGPCVTKSYLQLWVPLKLSVKASDLMQGQS